MAKRKGPTALFQTVPAKSMDGLMMRFGYEDDGFLAFQYHDAAMRLASTFKNDSVDDMMLMPFLNLFRHAYELQMKELIYFLAAQRRKHVEPENPDLASKAVSEQVRNHVGHNLNRALQEVHTHWNELELSEQFPEELSKLIEQIHQSDKSGTAFRYSGSLVKEAERISFPMLVELLDKNFRLLGSVYDWVDALFDAVPDPWEYY